MDFIRFEITPCMLKCNHFKPRNNFWSFSIVNWLVATSSIKRAASNQHTKKNNEFSITCLTMRHACTYEQIPMLTVFWIYDFWQGFFFILWSPRWIRTISQKKELDYISALFLLFFTFSCCVDFYY